MITKKQPRLLTRTLFNNNGMKSYFEPMMQILFPHWRINYFRAKIVDIIHENKNTFSITLQLGTRFNRFKAGQYIELCLNKNGRNVSRYFSISSPPYLYKNKKRITLTIQKQKDGAITQTLADDLKIGQYVHNSKPLGHFHLNNTVDYSKKDVVFIAGGSGITPIKSMVEEAIYQNNKNSITVLYYAHLHQHLFKDEWLQINNSHKNINVYLIDSKTEGHINHTHLNTYCPEYASSNCYICGPHTMIHKTKNLLNKSMDKNNIHHEFFGPKHSEIEIISEKPQLNFIDSNLTVDLAKNEKQTVLEVAESSGLKPQTGCRIGICHQCICQKQSGVVYNTLTQTYSDTGKQDIQLCVSVAIDNVSINL